MPDDIQKFEVNLKAFIMKEGKLLILKEAKKENMWELPGGRIDLGEEKMDSREILLRETLEELGTGFEFEAGRPAVTWIREFKNDRKVFLVGFLCEYKGGEIKLSNEHSEFAWIDENSYKNKNYRYVPTFKAVLDDFWKE